MPTLTSPPTWHPHFKITYHDRTWGTDGEHIGQFGSRKDAADFARQRDWVVHSIERLDEPDMERRSETTDMFGGGVS